MHSLTFADCDENQWGVHSTSTCSLQHASSLHPRTSAQRLQTCPALVQCDSKNAGARAVSRCWELLLDGLGEPVLGSMQEKLASWLASYQWPQDQETFPHFSPARLSTNQATMSLLSIRQLLPSRWNTAPLHLKLLCRRRWTGRRRRRYSVHLKNHHPSWLWPMGDPA